MGIFKKEFWKNFGLRPFINDVTLRGGGGGEKMTACDVGILIGRKFLNKIKIKSIKLKSKV